MTEHDKALIREALLMGLDSARTEAGEAIRMYGSYPKDGPGGRKVENAERIVKLFDDALVAIAEVQTLPQDREALMYRLRRMSVALRHRPIPIVDVILLMRQAATALEASVAGDGQPVAWLHSHRAELAVCDKDDLGAFPVYAAASVAAQPPTDEPPSEQAAFSDALAGNQP